jgi:hypothetical protein
MDQGQSISSQHDTQHKMYSPHQPHSHQQRRRRHRHMHHHQCHRHQNPCVSDYSKCVQHSNLASVLASHHVPSITITNCVCLKKMGNKNVVMSQRADQYHLMLLPHRQPSLLSDENGKKLFFEAKQENKKDWARH